MLLCSQNVKKNYRCKLFEIIVAIRKKMNYNYFVIIDFTVMSTACQKKVYCGAREGSTLGGSKGVVGMLAFGMVVFD